MIMCRNLEINLAEFGEDSTFHVSVPEDRIIDTYAVLGVWKKGRPKVWYPYEPTVYDNRADRKAVLSTFHDLIKTWDEKTLRRPLCLAVVRKVNTVDLNLEAVSLLRQGKPADRVVDWIIH